MFINLAATFVGILLTVFYVDLILRKHEEKRWGNVNDRIAKIANISITTFRSAYGFGVDIFDSRVLETDDAVEIRTLIAQSAYTKDAYDYRQG